VDFAGKRRGMGLALYVIAVALVVWGGFQLRSWTWDTADGQVQSCELSTSGRGSATQYTQHCVVSWTADGVTRQATVDFQGRPDRTGSPQKLLIRGDQAQAYGGRVYGLILAGFGVALALAGFLLRRS